MENEKATILWDYQVKTDRHIQCNNMVATGLIKQDCQERCSVCSIHTLTYCTLERKSFAMFRSGYDAHAMFSIAGSGGVPGALRTALVVNVCCPRDSARVDSCAHLPLVCICNCFLQYFLAVKVNSHICMEIHCAL